MNNEKLLLAALGVLGTSVGGAQEAPQQVVVTATRLPTPIEEVAAAIDVVGHDQVQLARPQVGLDESLAQMPGLFMQDRYNFAQDLRISIRGFGARANFGIRGVRIFVDGIPETLPDGQGQVDSIDLGSVERITVLRGSASALYGNAAGGVILIDSEQPPERTTVDARLSVGELGFSKHQLKIGGTAGKLGYMINLADMQLDGYRAQSDVRSRSVNATARYAVSDEASLKVALNYTDQPTSDDPGALTADEVAANPRQAAPAALTFDGGESVKQTRIGFVLDKAFGGADSITARNYYVWRSFDNNLAFQGGGAVSIERFFVGGGLAYTHHGELAGRPNRLVTGFDIDRQNDDRRRFNNDFGTLGSKTFDQTEKVDNAGIFLQDEFDVIEALTLSAGVRHDNVRFDVNDHFLSDGDASGRRTLRETSPMVGVLYRLTPSINLYGNIATSFETPTTTELANPAGGGFNPALDPQLATNREIGIKGKLGEHNRYTLALFDIAVKDELVPYEVAGQPGRSFFRNAGRSTRKGAELGFSSEPIEGVSLNLAYTYSNFKFDRFTDLSDNDFSGNRIPGLPRNVLHGGVAWHHPCGVFIGADALHVSSRYVDNANSVSDDAYTVTDLRFGYAHELGDRWRWSAFAGANNLFAETYNGNDRLNAAFGRYFEPAPRRNMYGGVEIRWVL